MGLVVAHEAERRAGEKIIIESLARIAEMEKAAKKKSPKRLGNILKEIGKDAGFFGLGYLLGRGSG
jgi:hypothetical protein